MKKSTSTPQITDYDIIKYYDLTEDHMRMFYKLDDSMGLHYGFWDKNTKTLAESITNTNRIMAEMAGIKEGDKVIDAGCGVGGSSIYMAKELGADCVGITLSAKQVESATRYAEQRGVADKARFDVDNYYGTKYEENTFDVAWALESMATARDKDQFLKEMFRILKPGGKLVIGDYYKPYDYPTADYKCMQHMLHHWMIPDLLTVEGQRELALENNFEIVASKDFTKDIKKSVNRIYMLALMGMIGTKAYVLTHPKATTYSRNHYKTGIGQYKGYKKGLWEHHVWVLQKPETTK